jgi:sugar phosphate isomerase/epimerase
MRALGIEFISVFGLPPVEFVALAADLGCRHVSTALAPIDYNPQGYPGWSLRDDAALRRDMVLAMADRDVSISLGEGLVVFPNKDVADHARDIEVMAELGVRRLNTLSFDPDVERSLDQFAKLADMAQAAGMELELEFTPSKRIGSFSAALDMVRRIGRANVRMLVDTMHFARSGSQVAELAAHPELIGYVQLCDAPLKQRFDSYVEEAMYERMVPGAGELPLAAILAATPRDRVVGLEIPLRSQAEAGQGPYERLEPCVAATRALLAEVDAAQP